jgi:hypothetical protein
VLGSSSPAQVISPGENGPNRLREKRCLPEL